MKKNIYTNINTFYFRRASPDGQSFRSSSEENSLKKWLPQKNSEDSDDDDYENVSILGHLDNKFKCKNIIYTK